MGIFNNNKTTEKDLTDISNMYESRNVNKHGEEEQIRKFSRAPWTSPRPKGGPEKQLWMLMFKARIYPIFYNIYEWTGLPFNERELERRLIESGYCGVSEHMGKMFPISINVKEWNFLNEPITAEIIEPLAPNLNGKILTPKQFVECRNSHDRISTRWIANPIIEKMEQVWLQMGKEIYTMQNKKLYNSNLFSKLENDIMNNLIYDENPMVPIDSVFENISKGILANKNFQFEDLEFNDITDRLLKKYSFYETELYKMLGLPINSSHQDKKERLLTAEMNQDNLLQDLVRNEGLSMRENFVEELNKRYNLNVSVKLREPIEQQGEENEPLSTTNKQQ